MNIPEFLDIMEQNSSDFQEFANMSQEQKETVANLNIQTGCAEAFYYPDGRFLGVGGIRVVGIGEAWMLVSREIQSHPDPTQRQAQFLDLLVKVKEHMARMCDENNLYRVFATGTLSTKFLEQLGFRREDKTLVWSRT